ncbi:hypothetical protein BKA70DRAFT_1384581 [Coprinopsis sp. MPI-PUGE-AT-0042]|nr:hypothetical protein BKA70DRAFT_1384581 [Coprinopsis sp. MPI-PUGE-AT-0042]
MLSGIQGPTAAAIEKMSKKTTIPARPKTYDISFKSILTFPLRICNPPPAVGKVRSCGVTPLFKVRLEDVLDRNHLPPLGLKDFEEWVLYVEMNPENLYFTLWLREYRERYAAWEAQNKLLQRFVHGPNASTDWDPETHHSPSLALFYLRAKQTFFTPNSPYELNIPSSLLAIFHSPLSTPHPDPIIFNDVAVETWRLLDESLRRFVSAQFNNVGNNRVLCGIIAGILFALIGTIPPLTLNFVRGEERWSRLAAFPGLFLGLAIFVSAFHGVCLGVYIFGDLRQLRKFELARPPISRPVPAPAEAIAAKACSVPSSGSLAQSQMAPANQLASAEVPEEKAAASVKAPTSSGHGGGGIIIAPRRPPSVASEDHSIYSASGDSSSGSSASSYHPPEIQISAAFHDNSSLLDLEAQDEDGQVAGIAPNYSFPAHGDQSPVDSEYTYTVGTAGFIHPFHEDPSCSSSSSLDVRDYDKDYSPSQRQPMDAFDFDALPAIAPRKRPSRVPVKEYAEDGECCQHHHDHHPQKSHGGMTTNTSTTALTNTPNLPALPMPKNSRTRLDSYPRIPDPVAHPKSFLERQQSKCDIKKWRIETQVLSADDMGMPSSPSSPVAPSTPASYHTQFPNANANTYNWHVLPANKSRASVGMIGAPPPPHTRVTTSLPAPPNGIKAKYLKAKSSGCPSSDSSSSSSSSSTHVKKRHRLLNAVPAFAVPLTRVLSPVIRRGQWEIVVRSAMISFLVSWVVVGVFLAVPVPVRS